MPDTTTIRRIAIGADHGGYPLKETIKSDLKQRGFAVEDVGTHSTDAVDYPVFARAVADRVASGNCDVGIVIDKAGIGSSMAANKVPGVRAGLCHDLAAARNSREHNNANVLSLGSGVISPELALEIVGVWLKTRCTEDRHLRRARMIEGGVVAGAGSSVGPAVVESRAVEMMPAMEQLSEEDIQRIAQRMAELSGGGSSAAFSSLACSCFQACAETNPEFVRQLVGMGADRVGHEPGAGTVPGELAKYIDHTLLKPDATLEQIEHLCQEAAEFGFASVCVNPPYVRACAEWLKGTGVKVCTVVGFPLGTHVPEIKALEARRAIRDGAREIDMVINIGALKGHDESLSYRDIRAVTDVCMESRVVCKVILETALLSDDEKVRACRAAKKARADFVKTSTGFGGGGATAHDVALMADAVSGTRMGVKASGGIRSYEDAQKMIAAGATRLGASAGVKILSESRGLTVSGDGAGERY